MVRAMSQGQVPMAIEALTDSYSIFSYLAAAHLKLPAEKGTFYHLAYLRERLVSSLIGSYTWVDTRDMVADGLTKGRADRAPLISVMHGNYALDHICHEYSEPSTAVLEEQYVQRDPVVAPSPRVTNATTGNALNQHAVIENDCDAADYWENLTHEVLSQYTLIEENIVPDDFLSYSYYGTGLQ